jgi:glycolate oxidase
VLVDELRAICGDEWVYTQQDQLRTYESDGLLQYHVTPAAAVLPGTAEEVRQVVAACARAEVPWVARGAGSGLSGGALPVHEGVLLVVSRMKRILEIDLENARVCVEPGITNAAVSAAVGPGFFYPPDPSSQIVCSIGGNVAENSGGAHCFKYGFTTTYVTGLELVLSDGEMIQVGGYELDSPGYDLLGAFVGSEGTLGVATKVWLRVVPSPESVRTLVAFFDHTREAGEAVSAIVQGGMVPGAIEMMDAKAIEASEISAKAGFPIGRGAALLVELDGSEHECEAQFEDVRAICERCGSDDVRVARDEAERQRFWKARKAAFAAMGRISPNYFVQDGVIPRTTLPDVLDRIDELAAEYGLVVANVFHAGDGNLHPLVCYDGAVEGQAERAEELSGRILDVCLDAGGSITGEHGVGVDKKRHMPKMFAEADLDAFQRLRCAFDPAGLANPGKVMPTPRLCGEVPGPYRQHPLEAAGLAERF